LKARVLKSKSGVLVDERAGVMSSVASEVFKPKSGVPVDKGKNVMSMW
jgi:hypothetical protein